MEVNAWFARALRAARRHVDMSQRELARWSSVPKSTIADAESGCCDVSLRTARRLLATAGLHLVIVDDDQQVLDVPTEDPRRDRAGRRFPPHLDLRERPLSEIDRLSYESRYRHRPPPPVTFRLDRDRRDALRAHGFYGDRMWPRVPRRCRAPDMVDGLRRYGFIPLPWWDFAPEIIDGVVDPDCLVTG